MQVTSDQLERVRFQALARFNGDEDKSQECVIQFWREMQTPSALRAKNPEAQSYYRAVHVVRKGKQALRKDRPRGEKRDATGRVLETCTIDESGNIVRVPRYIDALPGVDTRAKRFADDLDGRPSRAAIATMQELDALASA